MVDALVIIPTYNERDNVEPIAQAVMEASDRVELLFVDDSSPDGTGAILDRLASASERVHVLHRTENPGFGRAYVAGFRWALERDYQFVVGMDADFSHNPADVPRMLDSAREADLVQGSRYIGGIRIMNWPLRRLILSRTASLYVHLITGMPFEDPTGGFKCFRRDVLQNLDLDHIHSNGYSFLVEITHMAWIHGFRVVEVPIVFEERRSGQSKMNLAIVREAVWMVWKILFRSGFRRRPRSLHPSSVASTLALESNEDAIG